MWNQIRVLSQQGVVHRFHGSCCIRLILDEAHAVTASSSAGASSGVL
jgi:hypothetical protein